jgi:hypothetical protein
MNLLLLYLYCDPDFYLLLLYPVIEILTFWNDVFYYDNVAGYELVTCWYAEFYCFEFWGKFLCWLEKSACQNCRKMNIVNKVLRLLFAF